MLAFGNRKQFIPKIRQILQTADAWSASQPEGATWQGQTPQIPDANSSSFQTAFTPGIAAWCLAAAPTFPTGSQKFYRFYSYDDMHCLFADLAAILQKSPTLGDFLKGKAFPCLQPAPQPPAPRPAAPRSSATPSSGEGKLDSAPQRPSLASIIAECFPTSAIVPKGESSANKRIHMFLRWMVRKNSPVDLGLWDWYNPADLLIPLDVHVMQEAVSLGLLSPDARPTARTARILTAALAQAFPGDPSRADFALFGLGVDKT